eukprot:1318015-Prymnesium_polylepis.1
MTSAAAHSISIAHAAPRRERRALLAPPSRGALSDQSPSRASDRMESKLKALKDEYVPYYVVRLRVVRNKSRT